MTPLRLKLLRTPTSIAYCSGAFYVDDKIFATSLEDTDRRVEDGGKKIPGETAIPRGRYEVTIDFSQKFGKEMMHVLDVPQFSGIRIHAGNDADDTEGCILLGNGTGKGFLTNSRNTVGRLFNIVREAIDAGRKVYLEVI